MCEEGNLPVCHISHDVMDFLFLHDMTSITFSHAWLDSLQQSQHRHKGVCVFVCVKYLSFLALYCRSLCTLISPPDLWVMCATVCLPASLSDKCIHIILRKLQRCDLCLPTRGCVSQLVQMMQNRAISTKKPPNAVMRIHWATACEPV